MKSSDMKFEYPDDREYFEDLFSEVGGLTQNSVHFDFRDPDEKRREFNRIRNRIFEELESMHGGDCQLKCHSECEGVSTQVDHPIPLSSNVLNKQIREMKGIGGKKVPTQSFG